MKKTIAILMSVMLLVSLFSGMAFAEESALSKIDMTKWQYEASDEVYWQVGLSYAANPADSGYETMGVFVPGAYFTAADNGDGTWTCEVNAEGTVGAYTAETAPLVIPVNTPGYSKFSVVLCLPSIRVISPMSLCMPQAAFMALGTPLSS